MNPRLSNIHANKLAKYNYKYLDTNGDVYIGTIDGRLTKTAKSTATIITSDTGIINQEAAIDAVISQETNLSPFLLMGG